MYKLLMLLLLVVICPALVAGQDDKKERRFEIFAGFSYLMTDAEQSGSPIDRFDGLDGFNIAGTGYITRRFGITADFSAHFRKDREDVAGGQVDFDSKSFSYLAGPHFKFKNKSRVEPFVHALAGVANNRFSYRATATGASGPGVDVSVKVTDFAMAFGGGLDVRVNNRVALRAFQLDYNPVFLKNRPELGINGGRRFDNFRFSIGVVFR